MKTCGTCKHWERAPDYRWGDCEAPIPIWALDKMDETTTSAIFPDDARASDCECYEEKA